MYEFIFYPGTIIITSLQNAIDIRDIIICKSHQIYQIDRCDRIFNVRFIVARRIWTSRLIYGIYFILLVNHETQ